MSWLTTTIAFCERDTSFQYSLLLLLVSIILSIRTCNTALFFASSGACLFTATGTMLYELSRGWTAGTINVEMMAATVLSGMLFVTFPVSIASGMRAFVVNTHTAIAFALCVCLSVGACAVWMDLGRDKDLMLDQSKVRAAIFSNVHLVASILVVGGAVHGRSNPKIATTASRTESPVDHDRKVSAMV